MAITKVSAALVDLDGGVVINESSADADFRVESNGNTHMLFVDGGNDCVSIGASTNLTGALNITHGNEFGLVTSGSFNFQAKFESTDAEAGIVIEDSNSGTDYNRIGVITNDMAFTTNNSERMRIDSSGNVGIGETAPLASLHIKQGDSGLSSLNAAAHHLFLEDTGSNGPGITFASGTSSNCTLAFGDSDSNYRGFILYDNSADQLKMGISGSEVLRVDTNLLVNSGAVSAPTYSFIGDTNTGMSRPTADTINFVTGGTERMRIDSAGRLCVNTTGPINLAHTFEVNHAGNNVAVFNNVVTSGNPFGIQLRYSGQGSGTGGDAYTYYTNSSGSFVLGFAVRATGNVVNTNNSYGQVSDRKLKENIVDATNKLDELKQIKIRNFNFIGDDTKQIGVIAQELETIFPALITDTEDVDVDGNNAGTTTKEVKYSVLLPIAIKAIQELTTKLEAAEARITTLEG